MPEPNPLTLFYTINNFMGRELYFMVLESIAARDNARISEIKQELFEKDNRLYYERIRYIAEKLVKLGLLSKFKEGQKAYYIITPAGLKVLKIHQAQAESGAREP